MDFWGLLRSPIKRNVTEAHKNTTVAPKNVPGRGDMMEALKRGMGRPKRKPNDYPMPGRRVT